MATNKNRLLDQKGQTKNVTSAATKKKQAKAWDALSKSMAKKKKYVKDLYTNKSS